MSTTHHRACNLCEAICGLEIKVSDDGRIESIRGDKNDPLSRGYICPKATALADLQDDPDRLTTPMKRVGDQWQSISWDDAIEEVTRRLREIGSAHGSDAVGIYRGNPCVHNWGLMTHPNTYLRRLGTRNNFSATSVDQLPHHLICYWMYGHQFLQPIPDIDRTDFMLIIGYNPIASNGSIMTVPDFRGRLKALQQRGGRAVVIDPRRTETAAVADAHHFIRPGTDAALLLAMIHTLLVEKLTSPNPFLPMADELHQLETLVAPFSPEAAAEPTGISADGIRSLAREFAAAESACCHGRMGVSTQRFGTLCQWAIQVLHLLTGNLDREGGVLLPEPIAQAAGPADRSKGNFARRHSRVSGYPEFSGEFPVGALAEEILTAGEGQIRAMVTVAGNPVLSCPNGRQLDQAFESLEFMVSVDIYINETTRHADIILPTTPPLEHDHFDFAFHKFAVRNTAKYSQPVLPKTPGAMHDWEIFNALAAADAALTDTPFDPLPEPRALLAGMIAADGRVSVDALLENPSGVDLGPLQPSLADRLCTDNGQINVIPTAIPGDIDRLHAELQTAAEPGTLRLIGRRHIRSNNSWMHNSHRLTKGPRRDQLMVHPDDLASRGVADGDQITLRSRTGEIKVEVQASDEIMPGTVSLPHGWGHQREGVHLSLANSLPGASVNDITDERFLDELSGNTALNGVPVHILA